MNSEFTWTAPNAAGTCPIDSTMSPRLSAGDIRPPGSSGSSSSERACASRAVKELPFSDVSVVLHPRHERLADEP